MLRVVEADDTRESGELLDTSNAATTLSSVRSPGRSRRWAAEATPVADALLGGDTASEL